MRPWLPPWMRSSHRRLWAGRVQLKQRHKTCGTVCSVFFLPTICVACKFSSIIYFKISFLVAIYQESEPCVIFFECFAHFDLNASSSLTPSHANPSRWVAYARVQLRMKSDGVSAAEGHSEFQQSVVHTVCRVVAWKVVAD